MTFPTEGMEGMAMTLILAVNLLLIAAIVGLVHWLGRNVETRLDSAEAAKALFLAEFPTEKIAEIAIAGRGDGALLALDGERAVGLVAAMGAHWLVRRVETANFAAAEIAADGKLLLRLADFTAPRFALDLGSARSAALWRDRLERLRQSGTAALAALPA
jgi:hypothetical protein